MSSAKGANGARPTRSCISRANGAATPLISRPGSKSKAAPVATAPLDAGDPEAVEHLLAYIWADQHERIGRISAALEAAAKSSLRVEKADAADWVDRILAEPAEPGVVRVFFHTIVWQYLPLDTRMHITRAFAAAGAQATGETPLVWMYMEAEDHPGGAVLKQTVWPGGEKETLGLADYHGRWVDWA